MKQKKDVIGQASLSAHEKIYKKEIGCVVLAILFLFCFLSLISYNRHDPTRLSFFSDSLAVTNKCGALGATISGFLVHFYGWGSLILITLLLFPVYAFWFSSSRRSLIRTSLITLGLVHIVSTLSSLYHVDFLSRHAGGFVGVTLKRAIVPLVGLWGANLFLLGLLWVAITSLLAVPLLASFPLLYDIVKTIVVSIAHALYASCIALKRFFSWMREYQFFQREFFHAQTTPLYVDAHEQAPLETIIDTKPDSPAPLPEHKPSSVLNKNVIAIRRMSRPQRVLTTLISLPPNTVFSKNMFLPVNKTSEKTIADIIAATLIEQQEGLSGGLLALLSLPGLDLLQKPTGTVSDVKQKQQNDIMAKKLEEKLSHFGIKGKIVSINQGPVITTFEYQPEITSKISKILALEDDLAMALQATSIRIIAPIPGKNAIGVEIANLERQSVLFSTLLESKEFLQSKAQLPIILGVDVLGNPSIKDLVDMPHLLIGGTTGSGKSVGMNTLLLSLLYKQSDTDIKLILIDPKRLEFSPYAHIPHLLFPIISDAPKATMALKWVVGEMEERYERMARCGVRNIQEYRKAAKNNPEENGPMPYIVVMIDELADLMMVGGKEIETTIVRIAQMARASGIHLIVATQRPSVDVVTGLIKVNFPSRISFRVSTKVDSRTILDVGGGEKLLGKGDLLFMHASSSEVKRVHGSYVSDQEVERVATFLRSQRMAQYLNMDDILEKTKKDENADFQDELYAQVLDMVKGTDEISISMLQRRLRIGFNRSARIIEKLEMDGIIAPSQGGKPRKVIR